jgi:ribosomal-protein-alanine N-acetyltransferase
MDIQIRKTIKEDLVDLFEFQKDEPYNQMAAFTAENPSDQAAYLKKWKGLLIKEGVEIQTILSEEKVLGSVLYYEMGGELNLSYGIAPKHWGKGLATKAVGMFLEKITKRPIYARVAFDNIPSRRVLEKNGFQLIAKDRYFANARGMEIEELIFKLG